MPQAATLQHGLSADAAASGIRVPVRMLFVVVVLSALGGALATVLLEQVVVASEVTHGIPTASAHLRFAPPADTSVPDASEVFAGRAAVLEEPAPSF
jgi:hypothetical protein